MNKVKTFLLFYEAEICINIACLQSVRNCACLLSIAILLSKQTLSILKITNVATTEVAGWLFRGHLTISMVFGTVENF